MTTTLPALLSGRSKPEAGRPVWKLLNCLPVGVFCADVSGGTMQINKRGRSLLRIKKQSISVSAWLQSIHRDDVARVREAWTRLLRTGQEIECEYRQQSGRTRTQWVKISAARYCDSKHGTAGFVGSIADITDRKLMEKELRQSQKMDSIGRLAGGIAHDFNNLITIIMGNAEMLLLGLSGSQNSTRYEVRMIIDAAKRAAALTRQLLAYSRKELVEPKPLHLNMVVRDVQQMLARVIGENISLITRLPAESWPVLADPGQIEQILMNLAVNARDAMPSGGTLQLEVRNVTIDKTMANKSKGLRTGEYVQLIVSDTGCGIAREFLPLVFEPFFTTKAAGVGTGMGLATVFGIVKQNQGHVEAKSRVGRGTKIFVYLPRWNGVVPEESPPEARQISSGHQSASILLVEDEDGVRELAKRVLESAGYSVFDAGGALQAIELAEMLGDSIDLLITDVIMPQLCGPQLAETLQSTRHKMKVLYCSGYTADMICPYGIMDEGLSFLRKPFTAEALIQKVNHVLRQGSETSADRTVAADTPLSPRTPLPSRATALVVL